MEQAYVSSGTSIDKGENARLSSFVGAIAISDLVKTTLGPAGLDKILQRVSEHDQSITITNDGATILKNVQVDNAAAKVLVDIAKVQDDQVGDGTTSVAVLAGELLRQAETLVNNRIHPQLICQGYRQASAVALQTLKDMAQPCDFEKHLFQVASTTLSSKLLHFEKTHFAQLAVNAVLRLQNSNNLEYIQVLSIRGGSLKDSYLEEGFLLEKLPGTGQPTNVKNARILLANTSMDTDKIKIYGSKVKVTNLNQLHAIEVAEKEKMKDKVDKILSHTTENGQPVNCFINRQLIYNYPESLFAERNVMAIEHADFAGIERLGAVLGGDVVSTFDCPEQTVLGECQSIDTILIGESKLVKFSGCKSGRACSIVLRGSSMHALKEAERSLHDALAVLTSVIKNPLVVLGGGCSEMAMAKAIETEAARTPGKKSLAMQSFATALMELPKTVADNAGYDAAELVTQLKAAHQTGSTAGLNMKDGTIANMDELGIRESFRSKQQMVSSAAEAAEMILRVDDIIKAAPRRREEHGY